MNALQRYALTHPLSDATAPIPEENFVRIPLAGGLLTVIVAVDR